MFSGYVNLQGLYQSLERINLPSASVVDDVAEVSH